MLVKIIIENLLKRNSMRDLTSYEFMKLKKGMIFIIIGVLIIIIGVIISKNMIKNLKIGNNINSQEIVDYILNINSYKANITVQVNSNKNTNKYILEQEYNTENGSTQVVIEPSNIAGVKTILKDGNLRIENTNLNLSKIFENYKELGENSLDLISFINDYKIYDKASFKENNNEIVLKTKTNNQNRYNQNKILYIDKEKKVPTKLIVEDNNQNTTINIQYNSIEIN